MKTMKQIGLLLVFLLVLLPFSSGAINIMDKVPEPQEPQPPEPVVQKKRSSGGGGCITQWGLNDRGEVIKRDLYNPLNGATVKGMYCVGVDPEKRKVIWRPDPSGLEKHDKPLSIFWWNPRASHLWEW